MNFELRKFVMHIPEKIYLNLNRKKISTKKSSMYIVIHHHFLPKMIHL